MWNSRPLNLSIIEDYRSQDSSDSTSATFSRPSTSSTISNSNLQQSQVYKTQVYKTIAVFDAHHLGHGKVEILSNAQNKLIAVVEEVDGETTQLSEKEIFHSGYLSTLSVRDMSTQQRKDFIDNLCYMKICTLRLKHLAIW
jgi:hypothetical protein